MIGFGALVLASALVAVTIGLRRRPKRKPNVVLISIDTLRANHLGCYGYKRKTSPRIDSLASRGVLFENVVSQSSWTLPSHMSIFTGLYPSTHGVETQNARLPRGIETLPMALRKAGYATAGIVSSPYVGRRYGFERGFDSFEMLPNPIPHNAKRMTGEALGELKKLAASDKPFFLFLHYLGGHTPYDPPPPFDTMFDPDYTGDIDGKGGTIARYFSPEKRPSERDLRHIVALYDGAVANVDRYIGRIYDALKTMKLADDTIFVVTSDHGEEFEDHGGMDHGRSLYDEVIRVPLVMACPGLLAEGKVVRRQVMLIDLAPTICDLLDVPKPPGMEGVSFASLARAKGIGWLFYRHPAFAYSELRKDQIRPASMEAIVSDKGEKLIVTSEPVKKAEYYDVAVDPRERRNLYVSESVKARSLKRRLERWLRRKKRGGATGAAALSERDRKILESLGYIEGGGKRRTAEKGKGLPAKTMREPRDAAVGKDGAVYVADFGNKCVRVFSPAGKLLATWGTEGRAPGRFRDPSGVAVDSEGNVYVADTWNQRIQKFSPAGKFLREFKADFYAPAGVAVDTKGDIYVSDTGNGMVKKLSPEGKLLWRKGRKGSGRGEFNAPIGIAVRKDGSVLVADSENGRIQILDSKGNFERPIRIDGWKKGVFNLPYIDLDARGNIYVTDPLSNRVLRLSRRGKPTGELHPRREGKDILNTPTGIAVDGQRGTLYVVDTWNHLLRKFPVSDVKPLPRRRWFP